MATVRKGWLRTLSAAVTSCSSGPSLSMLPLPSYRAQFRQLGMVRSRPRICTAILMLPAQIAKRLNSVFQDIFGSVK